MWKFNGNLKRNSIIAIIAGCVLTIGVVGTGTTMTAVIYFLSNPGTPPPDPGPGPGDVILQTIGARIAEYIDDRAADVVFGWCYNNTFVNLNITTHFPFYVDAVMLSGALDNSTDLNLSVIHEPMAENTTVSSSSVSSVVNQLEKAITTLNDTSPTISSIDHIFPPTLLWDIAFSDNTSLSIVYSKQAHVFAAINGTWEYSDFIFHGVRFPLFDYSTNPWDAAYLVLDNESEHLVLSALQALQDMIIEAFPEE